MEILFGLVAYFLIGFSLGIFFKFASWFYNDWAAEDAVWCVFIWPIFLAIAILKAITCPLVKIFDFVFD